MYSRQARMQYANFRKSHMKSRNVSYPPSEGRASMRPQSSKESRRARVGVDDLISEIDEYLAQQMAQEARRPRRNSDATVFVDMDEHGNMQVSYRKRECDTAAYSHLRTPPFRDVDTNVHVCYGRNTVAHQRQDAYVEGFDPDTGFKYDYNGNIVHVHREGSRTNSTISEYYHLEAARYRGDTPLLVHDPYERSLLLGPECKKRDMVTKFVRKLLRELESLGVMKLFQKIGCRRRGKRRPKMVIIRSTAADSAGFRRKEGRAGRNELR